MTLSYEEQIKIELNKIKEQKRKQKLEQARVYGELGRMLKERFPGITLNNFNEFISATTTGNEVLPTPPVGRETTV